MKKTIGILAHVDAGKTTFSEQVLYHTKSIRNRGRVDHKNSFLDINRLEKERGITIFSDQAIFEIDDSKYYLIDTPGHIDFSSEMERALSILDYAILIISGVEGIQGHTETIWNLLIKYNIPTFFFINKIDRTGADLEKVINEINEDLTSNICYINTLENLNMFISSPSSTSSIFSNLATIESLSKQSNTFSSFIYFFISSKLQKPSIVELIQSIASYISI